MVRTLITCWWPSINPQQFAEGLHFCHAERFSSVVVGPVFTGSVSGRSDVGDLVVYLIPDIHSALMKWLYGKIPSASLPEMLVPHYNTMFILI